MDSVAVLSNKERDDLFKETAAKRNMANSAIIEKDFWVCWTLDKLFAIEQLRPYLIFKGGTSLSKVYNVINRFSEDIDLSISRECFGFSEKEYLSEDMGTKELQRRKKALGKKCSDYVSQMIFPALRKSIDEVLGKGNSWVLKIDEHDPYTLLFEYPRTSNSLSDYSYIQSSIKLELGARSDHWPSSMHEIKSYAAEEFPNYFKKISCSVKTLGVERTFWEKVMALHAEAHRTEAPKYSPRFSRHYYDVAMMINKGIGDSALSDLNLLDAVRRHDILFWTAKWASYETARPGTLRLIPLESRQKELKGDYQLLIKEMVFSSAPTFEETMGTLRLFEDNINH